MLSGANTGGGKGNSHIKYAIENKIRDFEHTHHLLHKISAMEKTSPPAIEPKLNEKEHSETVLLVVYALKDIMPLYYGLNER